MNSYTWVITATGKLQNTTATDPRSHLVSKLEVRVVQRGQPCWVRRKRESETERKRRWGEGMGKKKTRSEET